MIILVVSMVDITSLILMEYHYQSMIRVFIPIMHRVLPINQVFLSLLVILN